MTELVQLTEHPAPWPHRDLDVAAMRARGHEPVPFRQFILKVHSRCNLSCTYCYVYEMADQGWPRLPRRMDTAVAATAADRIGEHARAHDLPSVDVILHGGEPLLAGTGWLTELAGRLRARVPAQVNIGVQTNGTLLRPHANWSCPPPGTGYADWLIAVFERWYSAPEQETRIRLYAELIQLVLGNPGAVEGLGLAPSTLIVVDTDGSIKQLDSLSSAY